jgi:hypothetical protein
MQNMTLSYTGGFLLFLVAIYLLIQKFKMDERIDSAGYERCKAK